MLSIGSTRRTVAGIGALFALFSLAGCKDGGAVPTAGGQPAQAASPGGTAKSYSLVTELRPENPEKLFAQVRWAHGVCASAAKLKNIPVKPFPTLPADFALARAIYASDGSQIFFKELNFKIEGSDVETGCDYKIVSYGSSEIARGGRSRITQQDEAGVLTTGEEMESTTEQVDPARLAGYTEAKVINGVQLKCRDADCIVDPALAVIASGRRPVLAAAKIDDGAIYGTPLRTEPVSLSVGKPIDLAPFKQEADK